MTEEIGAALRTVRELSHADVSAVADRVEEQLTPLIRREAAAEVYRRRRLYYSWTQMNRATAIVALYALALTFIGILLAAIFFITPKTAMSGDNIVGLVAIAVGAVVGLAVAALFPIYYIGES